MKNIIFFFLTFLTIQVYSQNNGDKEKLQKLSYENKIAVKACSYLSELDSISDTKKELTNSIVKATNKVHEEDTEKEHPRDWSVEGIRSLHKKVRDLLIKDCPSVSIR